MKMIFEGCKTSINTENFLANAVFLSFAECLRFVPLFYNFLTTVQRSSGGAFFFSHNLPLLQYPIFIVVVFTLAVIFLGTTEGPTSQPKKLLNKRVPTYKVNSSQKSDVFFVSLQLFRLAIAEIACIVDEAAILLQKSKCFGQLKLTSLTSLFSSFLCGNFKQFVGGLVGRRFEWSHRYSPPIFWELLTQGSNHFDYLRQGVEFR